MSQLYKIGILVALMLIILLGLSKLVNVNKSKTSQNADDVKITQDKKVNNNNSKTKNMNESKEGDMIVVMRTNKGDITIELFTEDMPITAGNFLKLIKEDFYDGVKFHRVIDGFMIQGGDPLTKDDNKRNMWGTGGPGYAIEDEHVPGFSNLRGSISMANSGPNSGGSQFFINLVNNVNLDYDKQPLTSKHPVFGKVIDGMDVVDAIGKVETGPRDVPVEPVVIEDIVVKNN